MRALLCIAVALVAVVAAIACSLPETSAAVRAVAALTTSSEVPTVRSAPIARGELPSLLATDTVAESRRTVAYVADPAPARSSEITTIAVTVRNLGNDTWNVDGAAPVRLSYHLYDATGALIEWNGPRTDLGQAIAPGESSVSGAPA